MANRKFRIVKRENNIPVLGICEYCNAEFTADPKTICRPKDGHAFIQKQFIAHKCKRLDAGQSALRILREDAEMALRAKWRSRSSAYTMLSKSPDTADIVSEATNHQPRTALYHAQF
jgi:hypothetical protein